MNDNRTINLFAKILRSVPDTAQELISGRVPAQLVQIAQEILHVATKFHFLDSHTALLFQLAELLVVRFINGLSLFYHRFNLSQVSLFLGDFKQDFLTPG